MFDSARVSNRPGFPPTAVRPPFVAVNCQYTSLIGTRLHQTSISSTGLSGYPGRSNPIYAKRASSSFLPPPDDQRSSQRSLLHSLPDEGILGIGKPSGDSAMSTSNSCRHFCRPSFNPKCERREWWERKCRNDLPPYQFSAAILWGPGPHSRTSKPQNFTSSKTFEDVLDKFHITLHPQTWPHATHSQNGSANPIFEPTLAWYCPIEGGGLRC